MIQLVLYISGTIVILQMITVMSGIFKRDRKPPRDSIFVNRPMVTVQLPIFNEGELVERLVEAIACMEYPKSNMQIQLLDDSTDHTLGISRRVVERYRDQGWDIELIHREDRQGHKAGALNNAMTTAKGKYILIFDADFAPPVNFLEKTLPHFSDDRVGFVKTNIRLANDTVIITKLYNSMVVMATQLDQVGRDRFELYQQISGSSFIIRREALLDVGGWSSDTVTEDCDLSYALYLKSWKNAYVSDIQSNCLAPSNLRSLWIQQYRWAKGTTQCYFKYRKQIGKNRDLSFVEKSVALCTGSYYMVFLLLLASFFLGVFLSLFFATHPLLIPMSFYVLMVISTPMTAIIPVTILLFLYKRGYSIVQGVAHLACTSVLFYCLAVPIARGVLSAFMKRRSAFVVTPK